MSTLQDRLHEVMQAKGWDRQALMTITRQSSSVVSQWLGKGSKEIKSIGKIEVAQALERASGFSALWIAKGIGPKHSASTTPTTACEPAAIYPARPIESAIDTIAAALLALPDLQARDAADALRAFAAAPDSPRARAAVVASLQATSWKQQATGT